jgi:hypothetical protein
MKKMKRKDSGVVKVKYQYKENIGDVTPVQWIAIAAHPLLVRL